MKGIPALTDYQREWIRKETSHFIFVDKDDNNNHICKCDRCGKTIDLGKTKHRANANCPECGHELEVFHNWRSTYPETIDWIAIPKVLNGNEFMLRYVLVWRHDNRLDINEVARGVFDIRYDRVHPFELDARDEWRYSRRSYFTEYNMYNFRKMCCLQADLYKPAMRELKKLDGMEYFDNFGDFTKSSLYAHTMIGVLKDRKDLYEKLCKAGLTKLAQDDIDKWGTYYRSTCINPDTTETSLLKMLGINRNQLNLLRNNQTLKAFNYIKCLPNADQKLLDGLMGCNVSLDTVNRIGLYGLNLSKTLKYFDKSKCNHGEYLHYISMLKSLEYKLDDSYVYPADFRKEDTRVSREYQDNLSKIKAKEEAPKNEIIRKISEGLSNNNELMDFFKGSDGLQVLVPESAEELRKEGRALHNCLGTYVDRVAKNQTLIFFIHHIYILLISIILDIDIGVI